MTDFNNTLHHASQLFAQSVVRSPLQTMLQNRPQHEKDAERERNARAQAAEDKAVAELRPSLTPEFLATLMQAVRIYGWSGDLEEIGNFVDAVHEMAGVKRPDAKDYQPINFEGGPV